MPLRDGIRVFKLAISSLRVPNKRHPCFPPHECEKLTTTHPLPSLTNSMPCRSRTAHTAALAGKFLINPIKICICKVQENSLQQHTSKGMEAGRAVSMLSSSSSFTAQLASPSSSSSSSAGSPSIASLCSLPSHTFFVAKTAGHGSHHLFPIMASSESAVSSNGPTTSAQTTPASAIDFLMLCQQLKITKRTGWVKHGLKETESIADHMHRMAVMAIIAAEVPGINKDRCVKMAVVHDIAEAEEMKDLWLEYENNASLEANLVKDFDKVEMILQALEYETTHGMVLNEFYESTAGKFQTDLGKAWAAEIIRRRKKRIDPTKQ